MSEFLYVFIFSVFLAITTDRGQRWGWVWWVYGGANWLVGQWTGWGGRGGGRCASDVKYESLGWLVVLWCLRGLNTSERVRDFVEGHSQSENTEKQQTKWPRISLEVTHHSQTKA
jgi:hypothetical protein